VTSEAGSGPLLRRNRPFATLWTARTISLVGSSVGQVGLLLAVAQSSSAVLAVTLLMLMGDLVPALLAPLTGVIADRVDLKRLMTLLELGQAAATAAIALWLPALPVLLALFLVRAVFGQVFTPATRAAVPALVDDRDLPSANAALGFGENGLTVLGPVLAAILIAFTGIRGLLFIDAATFLVSAFLLLGLPRITTRAGDVGPEGSFLLHAAEGITFLWRTAAIRLVFISFFAIVFFNAVDDVALVFLGKQSLHSGDSGVSLLYAGSAAGLIVGFAAVNRWGARAAAPALLVIGYAVGSLGNLLTSTSWAIAAVLVFQAIRGLGLAAQDTAASTMIQRAVPRELLGRTFANFYGSIGLAAGLSYLLGGVLLETTGPRATFAVAGLGGVVTAIATGIRIRSHRHRDQPEQALPDQTADAELTDPA
jgi:MFS family permease